MADEALLNLTADIVAAHLANNKVAVNDVPVLVARVYEALDGLGAPAEAQSPAKREPKISPRRAVKPDSITCLVCGSVQKTLKRHLMAAHAMTPADYREEFGLRPDYPLVAPNYARARSETAKRIGLGTKGRAAEAAAAPPEGGSPGRGSAESGRPRKKAVRRAERGS